MPIIFPTGFSATGRRTADGRDTNPNLPQHAAKPQSAAPQVQINLTSIDLAQHIGLKDPIAFQAPVPACV
jgi:hypothetical protein